MLLLVGLGNPGSKYAGNRHNIGFMALDAIAERHGFTPWRNRFQGEVAEGKLSGEKVIALKPLTYMNESGRAVGEAMRFYKLAPADVLVLHDELDLAPGKVKFKMGGGAAGHNGLRSIAQHIGQDFRRLRLGIGHPGSKDKVLGWVLNDFSKADSEWLAPLMENTAIEAESLIGDGQAESFFMSRVMQAQQPQKKERKKSEVASTENKAKKAEPQQVEEPKGLLAQALEAAFGKKDKKD